MDYRPRAHLIGVSPHAKERADILRKPDEKPDEHERQQKRHGAFPVESLKDRGEEFAIAQCPSMSSLCPRGLFFRAASPNTPSLPIHIPRCASRHPLGPARTTTPRAPQTVCPESGPSKSSAMRNKRDCPHA